MTINLPRLLGENMGMVGTVTPETTSISRNLHALSTAKVVLPPGEPAVKTRSFMRLYDRYGSAGVFRVSKVRSSYGQQVELSLKHGLCVLEDDTVKASEGKLTGTFGQILQTLWNSEGVTQAPRYWRLGSFAQTPSIEYEYSNPKLMDAVWELLKKAPGYALDIDQSVFPWVLNLVNLSDDVTCEGRFGRNLDSCTVNVDDSSLCTRVYLDDRDGYTDSPTIAEWGIVSNTLTVPEGADESAISDYVSAYLLENGEPRVTITLEAADMSAATGEALDNFAVGKMCRACLPDYGVTIKERIVTLTTPDVYGDPDGVVITMANRTETASSYLEKLRSSSKALSNQSIVTNRRVGGVSKKLENTDIELIRTKEELTDTRYRLSKAGLVIDKDAEFVKAFAYQETVEGQELRLSGVELILNGAEGKAGLVAQVEDQEGRLSSAELILNGDTASGGLVARVKGAEDTLDDITGSTLWTTRDSVTGLVGKFTINSAGDVVVNKGTGFLIQRDSGTFGVYDSGNLTAGVMVQKINNDTSVTISADRVNLEGYVTVSELEAVRAKINNLVSGATTAQILKAGEIHALSADFSSLDTGAFYIGGVGMTQHTQTIYKGGKITVNNTTNHTVYDTAGNPIGSVRGIPSSWSFTQYSDGEFVYLGPS